MTNVIIIVIIDKNLDFITTSFYWLIEGSHLKERIFTFTYKVVSGSEKFPRLLLSSRD